MKELGVKRLQAGEQVKGSGPVKRASGANTGLTIAETCAELSGPYQEAFFSGQKDAVKIERFKSLVVPFLQRIEKMKQSDLRSYLAGGLRLTGHHDVGSIMRAVTQNEGKCRGADLLQVHELSSIQGERQIIFLAMFKALHAIADDYHFNPIRVFGVTDDGMFIWDKPTFSVMERTSVRIMAEDMSLISGKTMAECLEAVMPDLMTDKAALHGRPPARERGLRA